MKAIGAVLRAHLPGWSPALHRTAGIVAALGLVVVSGCGSSGTPSAAPTTTVPAASAAPAATAGAATTGVDPNGPEVVEPGDIPDNQVFVAFAAPGGFSVDVPEGWARLQSGTQVTFTDNYNSIQMTTASAPSPPDEAWMRTMGLADVAADPTFRLTGIATVKRKAGTAVRATYELGSAPNPVTGKKALLAVERYSYFHAGTVAVITLSGAKGADNVDPWKTVTDSLRWS